MECPRRAPISTRLVLCVMSARFLPASSPYSAPLTDTQATVLSVIDGLSEKVSNPLGHHSSPTKLLQRQRWTLPASIAEPFSSQASHIHSTTPRVSKRGFHHKAIRPSVYRLTNFMNLPNKRSIATLYASPMSHLFFTSSSLHFQS